MASITLDDLDDDLVASLRDRAHSQGHSVEEEAVAILGDALPPRPKTGADLVRRMRELFGSENGVDLELPPRGPARPLPTFE